MSCGCSSTPVSPVGCTATLSAQPRRVGSQPIVPVTQRWAGQIRSAFQLELMGRDGDEILTLDGPIDGQVLYDANARKFYVGTNSATLVVDAYPCRDTDFAGLLLYAKDPGCRDLASNPDREMVVVRPTTQSTGWLFGHEHTTPSGPGAISELRPVEIEPADLPTTVPDGIYSLCYLKTTSNDACALPTYQWYKVSGTPPIDQTKLPTTEVTESDLQDLTDGFNFSGWRLVNGKWVTYRITNESFKVLLDKNAVSPTVWLDTPYRVMTQVKSVTPGAPGNVVAFPESDAAQAMPIVNQTEVVTLANVPGYFEGATSVKVEFRLKGTTINQLWDGVLVANNREYARVALPGDAAGDCCYNQADVPITGPSMDFRFLYQQVSSGSPGGLYVLVEIVAFNR